jgi:GT2 family glycosyltransferase
MSITTSPLISVVVVNWNGWPDTLKAYESLCNSSLVDWRLIVVDNASTDESCAELAKLGPKATLIRNPSNSGFAGGCNIGMKEAVDNGSKYIFLLNNDALVRRETLAALTDASVALNDDAILGCVVKRTDDGSLQYFGSEKSTITGLPEWFTEPEDVHRLSNSIIDVDFVFGAALFIPVSTIMKVGLFDERFFLTYEETDLCYRARHLAIRCCVVRDAIVDHVGSASMGASSSPLQAYFLHRNRLLFLEKHASARQRIRGIWKIVQTILGRIFANTSKRLPASTLTTQAIIIALRHYAFRRFGDCPSQIRRLAAQAAQVALQARSAAIRLDVEAQSGSVSSHLADCETAGPVTSPHLAGGV